MKGFVGRLFGPNVSCLRTQPAPQTYDGCRVLYCGYIANALALVEEAGRRGESLKSGTDGELFAKAYQWWGEEIQKHVLGEFALSVVDDRRAALFLTHDALGLVPIFYSKSRDGFAFSSSLDELVRSEGYEALDEEYIADYLATGIAASERTPYVGICRLLSGQSLRYAAQRVTVLKTWDITRIEPVKYERDEEYEERFRSLLCEGVSSALRSDGKIWSELSGGLDSSSIVSVAARSAAKLEAVSIIYTNSRSADESEWMKVVLQQYGLPWHTLDGDQSRPFAELPQGLCAEPTDVHPAEALFRRYKALADSHAVRVILSGYGGDQVFCGDAPRPYQLADLVPFGARRLLSALQAWHACDRERRSVTHHFRHDVLRPLLRHSMRRSLCGTEATATPAWIHPDYVRAMRLSTRSTRQVAPRCRSVGAQYLVERIWKAGVAAAGESPDSFDFRYPLLYRPLVEFMLAIPWEQRVKPGQDRYLQRRAMKGILPEQVRQRKWKAGPTEAEVQGLRSGSAWLDILQTRPRIVERGYVDAVAWGEALAQARFGRIVSMRHFVATATLEVWLRQLESRRNPRAMLADPSAT